MKSGLTILFIAIISYACMSNANVGSNYDVRRSDSITQIGIKYLHEQEERIEQKDNIMLDNIHSLRDNYLDTIIEIRQVHHVVKEVESVHDTIYVPVYKKLVYSIYTSRGAHVGCDTLN